MVAQCTVEFHLLLSLCFIQRSFSCVRVHVYSCDSLRLGLFRASFHVGSASQRNDVWRLRIHLTRHASSSSSSFSFLFLFFLFLFLILVLLVVLVVLVLLFVLVLGLLLLLFLVLVLVFVLLLYILIFGSPICPLFLTWSSLLSFLHLFYRQRCCSHHVLSSWRSS